VTVYGDASGHQQHTTGPPDYQAIQEYFRVYTDMTVQYRTPRANPGVRERLILMNAKLKSAAGEVATAVDPKCKELIEDFEQVLYVANSWQIDKDRDRLRTHLSDALGYLVWRECGPALSIGERPGRLLP
jgi:hypothetical protein